MGFVSTGVPAERSHRSLQSKAWFVKRKNTEQARPIPYLPGLPHTQPPTHTPAAPTPYPQTLFSLADKSMTTLVRDLFLREKSLTARQVKPLGVKEIYCGYTKRALFKYYKTHTV